MRTLRSIALVTLVALSATACTTGPQEYGGNYGNKQIVGTLAGAAAGAVAATNIGKGRGNHAAIAIGTLLGAVMGSEIGASLDRADQMYMNRTAQYSFETVPTGMSTQWQNPDSGNYGTITPVRTFQSGGGYCREFTQSIYVGGRMQEGYGVACRQPDGSWQFQG